MKPDRQEMRTEAATFMERVCRAMRSIRRDETAVTAIEYALLAALIVIVALVSIAALGGAVSNMWAYVSTQVAAAL